MSRGVAKESSGTPAGSVRSPRCCLQRGLPTRPPSVAALRGERLPRRQSLWHRRPGFKEKPGPRAQHANIHACLQGVRQRLPSTCPPDSHPALTGGHCPSRHPRGPLGPSPPGPGCTCFHVKSGASEHSDPHDPRCHQPTSCRAPGTVTRAITQPHTDSWQTMSAYNNVPAPPRSPSES